MEDGRDWKHRNFVHSHPPPPEVLPHRVAYSDAALFLLFFLSKYFPWIPSSTTASNFTVPAIFLITHCRNYFLYFHIFSVLFPLIFPFFFKTSTYLTNFKVFSMFFLHYLGQPFASCAKHRLIKCEEKSQYI